MKKNWKQDTITINDGIELFYTRTGRDKPVIILAHGKVHSGLCWHQLASDLEADYDLIMFDAYGHGKSSRVDPDKKFDLSENLHDLIEVLGLENPGIIGHSMGAATAASFAAAHPEMLSALVLEDPPWIDGEFDEKQIKKTLQERKKRILTTKEKTVKELIKIKKKESPKWEESILKEWAQAKLDFDPAVFDHTPIRHEDWRDLAKAITTPTLLVTGDNALGAFVTPELGVEAIQILDKGEFGHISSAGHCVRYDQYQPYLTMVKLFLNRNISGN